MAKKKRRFYFAFFRTAKVEEMGHIAVDAYNLEDAEKEIRTGKLTEFLCDNRAYDDIEWEFTPVESPNDKTD